MTLKSWQDALEELDDMHITTHEDVRRAMLAEIDALREQLAAAQARVAELEARLQSSLGPECKGKIVGEAGSREIVMDCVTLRQDLAAARAALAAVCDAYLTTEKDYASMRMHQIASAALKDAPK
jgi:hypothetical protein